MPDRPTYTQVEAVIPTLLHPKEQPMPDWIIITTSTALTIAVTVVVAEAIEWLIKRIPSEHSDE